MHLSECEGVDFQEQFVSLADSYRARTERAGMVVSGERRKEPKVSPLASPCRSSYSREARS